MISKSRGEGTEEKEVENGVMGLFDIFKSQKKDDPASAVKLDDPALAAIFKSRKKDDRAETAFLHMSQLLVDVMPEIDNMYRLEVFGQQTADEIANRVVGFKPDSRRTVDHTSKGFQRGLIKKRAFISVFIMGAFKACYPQDTNRYVLLLQAASGASILGLVDQPDSNGLTRDEVATDVGNFMLEVVEQSSVLLSNLGGFIATCESDPHAFHRGMKPLHDLYHEIYSECFGKNYTAILDDGESLRDEFHKQVIENVQFCIEMMQKACKEIGESQAS